MKIGPLPFFSAYPFENFLQLLKKLLRKSDKHLQQVVKRVYELSKILSFKKTGEKSKSKIKFGKQHVDGPLPTSISNAKQYESMELGSWYLCPKSEGDRCVYIEIESKKIVVDVENIIASPQGFFIVGKRFTQLDNIFEYPLESKNLDIF